MKNCICVSLFAISFSLSVASNQGIADEPAAPKLNKADIEAMMKSLSNWGRWGSDDQLGALNLITPEKRKKAAALVTEGVTVSLAHNVIKETRSGSPPFGHKMTTRPQA